MIHPDVHRDLFRQREAEIHRAVLQQARNGDLSTQMRESRVELRTTFLARMWARRTRSVRAVPASLEP